jgi:16S rRNA (guanine(1405)-N(7))-methyltransferase
MTSKQDRADIEVLNNEAFIIEGFIADVSQSKKYRNLGICADTIRDLVAAELKHHSKRADAIKAAKKKLHQVVAPYLGDPDYPKAATELETAFDTANPDTINETCARIMLAHATTKERLSILNRFYRRTFEVTGIPTTILDLACGLHPFSFPWMGLPPSTQYYAYDIHQKRINFLNHYFSLQGLPPLAKLQDVLVDFPREKGDVAFILKEVHRFERRRSGCTLPLLDTLRVRYLVISFPTQSLDGRRNLTERYRALFHSLIKDRPWPVTEIKFENELVFYVEKS